MPIMSNATGPRKTYPACAGKALSLTAGAQASLACAHKSRGVSTSRRARCGASPHLLWMVAALVVLKQHRASWTEILAAFTAAASS